MLSQQRLAGKTENEEMREGYHTLDRRGKMEQSRREHQHAQRKRPSKTRTTKGKLTGEERSRENPRTTETTGPEADWHQR